MVFSSIIFLFLFLPFTLTLYFLVGRKLRNLVLLLANLFFYTWGEGKYVSVLLVCIVTNYLCAALIEKYKHPQGQAPHLNLSKLFLVVAVIFNLGLLIYFKFTNFIVENVNYLALLIGFQPIRLHQIHLPLGISFFVFQALSYVIDVYRGVVKATYSLFDFALYKSLFPQLIAGPIVRYRDVAGQMVNRLVTTDMFALGVGRFIIGLGKKVLIANTVAVAADRIFAVSPHQLTAGAAWLGVVCYSLQIYFDFSGYSDMAIGLGYMLGFKFLENFNYPYISKTVQEFWRRWHISLSTWFRDYLYISLGGNRCAPLRVYANLLVVFLLCGFWHGASWTFVIWGVWHGLFLVLERLPVTRFLTSMPALLGHLYTLLVIMVGWVFFRSPDLAYALHFIAVMFTGSSQVSLPYDISRFMTTEIMVGVAAGIICSVPVASLFERLPARLALSPRGGLLLSKSSLLVYVIYLCGIFFISTMSLASSTYNPFIYFRF
jgi:alginate O-acetyltransferase complex protein AlgI